MGNGAPTSNGRNAGAQVRKGEKATLVVFWKFANNAAETDDDTPRSGSRLSFTRGYSVFNAAQVDGYATKLDAETPIEQRIESASNSSPGSKLTLCIWETAHSIHPIPTPSPSRRLLRFSRRWITTRRGHTKPGIGRLKQNVATTACRAAGSKGRWRAIFVAFFKVHVIANDTIVEGDRMVERHTAHAAHTGHFSGHRERDMGVPPSP